MYKVFINDSSISFTSIGKTSAQLLDKDVLQQGVNIVKQLTHHTPSQHLVFVSKDVEKTWQAFIKQFTLVEAAGGIVKNGNGDTLLIKRLGKWDLPKGKMEKGESKEESALREVVEECGIPVPNLIKPLPTTYHYYALRDAHIIKPTYWFEMEVGGIPALIPQTEEAISEVIWAKKQQLKSAMENTYASIKWILEECKKL